MNIELFPLLVAKVGDRERVATTDDISDVHDAIVKALTTDGILVTHHAVQFEVVQVPVASIGEPDDGSCRCSDECCCDVCCPDGCGESTPADDGCCPVCCGDCGPDDIGCVEPVILGVDSEGNLIYQADEADEASVYGTVDSGAAEGQTSDPYEDAPYRPTEPVAPPADVQVDIGWASGDAEYEAIRTKFVTDVKEFIRQWGLRVI
jgi:hypothetical protein